MNKDIWVLELYTQDKDFIGINEYYSLEEAKQYANKFKEKYNYIHQIYLSNGEPYETQ